LAQHQLVLHALLNRHFSLEFLINSSIIVDEMEKETLEVTILGGWFRFRFIQQVFFVSFVLFALLESAFLEIQLLFPNLQCLLI
jgi:hypothetical protein